MIFIGSGSFAKVKFCVHLLTQGSKLIKFYSQNSLNCFAIVNVYLVKPSSHMNLVVIETAAVKIIDKSKLDNRQSS
jgi:hypothetical protein